MIKLTIDDREVEVENGTNILQACIDLGIEIPRFCYHEKLSIAGSCRMCLVEIDRMPGVKPSCVMKCTDGMHVKTNTDIVKQARQNVMEMLLINHPLDCPVCDQGGECDLQDEAFAYGADRCRSKEVRRQVSDKELGPPCKNCDDTLHPLHTLYTFYGRDRGFPRAWHDRPRREYGTHHIRRGTTT